jgi:hypothetical protein
LNPAGVDTHVHSFEESLYVIGGACGRHDRGSVELVTGDYGLLPVGVTARSATRRRRRVLRRDEGAAPRERFDFDTRFRRRLSPDGAVDVRDPRTRLFGHIEPANMDVGKQTQDLLAASASMRTALLVYSGITVKMMVDSDLGAQLTTMFMVQYSRAASGRHHAQETYLILEGEVDAEFDSATYRLGPVTWPGPGSGVCTGSGAPAAASVAETQAPMRPDTRTGSPATDHLTSCSGGT